MSAKIQVIFYSKYGQIYRLAEAVAEGARQVAGAEVSLFQVPELVPETVRDQSGAKAARQSFAHIPIAKVDQLPEADAILFGTLFASTGTQHGGQETTITSFHTTLLHQGMIVVGVPYSCPGLVNMNEITGGTPYGATTLSGSDNSRQPSENELTIARFQGKHVAEIACQMVRGKK
jgi:NAD(P)H dehydrogenase (quinone)